MRTIGLPLQARDVMGGTAALGAARAGQDDVLRVLAEHGTGWVRHDPLYTGS